jgi:hypothetical protein
MSTHLEHKFICAFNKAPKHDNVWNIGGKTSRILILASIRR